jgi:hypothetical protein
MVLFTVSTHPQAGVKKYTATCLINILNLAVVHVSRCLPNQEVLMVVHIQQLQKHTVENYLQYQH